MKFATIIISTMLLAACSSSPTADTGDKGLFDCEPVDGGGRNLMLCEELDGGGHELADAGDAGGYEMADAGDGGGYEMADAGPSPVDAGPDAEPPTSWTCDPVFYGAGDDCDCECGAYDPDCDDPTLTILNCDRGQICNASGNCS